MDFGDFYTFHDAGEEDAVHFGVTTRFADTAAWRRLLRGELGSDQRIALSHEEGTRAYDIVSASRTHVRPCSRRFFEVVRLAGFTGITSYALELEAPRAPNGLKGQSIQPTTPRKEGRSRVRLRSHGSHAVPHGSTRGCLWGEPR
jgi:hypothetical protein